MNLRLTQLLVFLALFTTGCATLMPGEPETPDTPDTRAPAEAAEPGTPAAHVVRPPVEYDGEVLADLLIAEVAAQQRNLTLSLEHYVRAARRAESPLVRARATRLAAYVQNHELILEMAELWLAVEPAAEPRELAALAQISLGRPERAADHIDHLLATNPDQALASLVRHARSLDPMGNEGLLEALASLAERYPDQPSLWHARALHLHQQGHPEQALEAVQRTRKQEPAHHKAAILEAQILHELGRVDESLEQLRSLVRKNPESRQARIAYVRLLLEEGRDDTAYEQLQELADLDPHDQDLRYSLALYGLEFESPSASREALKDLLDEGYRPDQIRFYLARAAEQEGDLEDAIEHYLKVVEREHRFEARIHVARLYHETQQPEKAADLLEDLRDHYPEHLPMIYATQAELLKSHDRPDEAMALLDEALVQLPDHRDLLYARALTAERLDRVEQSLDDLARILAQDPNDVHALNARGYILTDRTDRHEEAREHIEKALAMKPDNPAIMDSMGWVLFNLGKPEEALEYLEPAWQAFPDGEVGAHLVEVLWSLDRHDEAREIWEKTHEQDPDSRHLEEVRERLLE